MLYILQRSVIFGLIFPQIKTRLARNKAFEKPKADLVRAMRKIRTKANQMTYCRATHLRILTQNVAITCLHRKLQWYRFNETIE